MCFVQTTVKCRSYLMIKDICNMQHLLSERGSLQTLIIRDERVSGTLPAGYPAALPRLQVLSLSGLLLGGSLPGAWAGWSSLRQLALYSNQVRAACAPVY